MNQQSYSLPYPDTQMLIAGQWRPARDNRTLEVTNPATGEEIGRVACAGHADLEDALRATVEGFAAWRRTSAFDRCALLRRAATLVRERCETIATWLTMEQGKPLSEARTEVLASADIIDWFAEEARRDYGRIIPARLPGVRQMVIKDPVGPVAAFTPWNFPVSQLARKLAAALAAGCSIIVKAAEETPAAPAALVRAIADAGLPDGAVGLVYGQPSEISEYLIPHPVIRKVSFTGSTEIGKLLAAMAGRHMKRVTMELGGHAPVLVAADADLDRAVSTMVATKYRNAGQVCVSPTRFLVEQPVYDAFVESFVKATNTLRIGNGLDADTTMGPLANGRRVSAMESMITDARGSGARLVCGGERVGNAGHFFAPTVLADVPISANAMNEEPFGPLALMVPMPTLDDMIAEANRLPYGLAAYGFTNSAKTAGRLADEVQSGMMSINHLGLALPEVPFGGINDSGYGTEGGADALDAYVNARFVSHLQAI